MQRLSSLNRIKENAEEHPRSKERKICEIVETEIPNDILFLISRMNKKMNPPSTMNKNVSINPERAKVSALYLTGNYRWTYNRGMKHLKRIEISNCGIVPLEYFEGLKLKSIVFKNVNKVEEYDFEDFTLESLHIKDSQMSSNMLMKVISNLSPLTLILENIKNISGEIDELKILDLISKKDILDLQVIDSFLSIDKFIQLVNHKKLNKFYCRSNNSIIKYSAVFQYLSYLKIRNLNISRYLEICPEWRLVDVLSIDTNTHILNNMSVLFNRLKHLQMEDVRINSDIVKKLPNIVSIHLINCSFESMCFYKLIDTQFNTLKSISFKNVSIPFDGYEYIKSNVNDCKIIRTTEDRSFLYSGQDTWVSMPSNRPGNI